MRTASSRAATWIALVALAGASFVASSCKSRAARIDCERTCGCRDHGLCELDGSRCVASDDDQCRASRMCALVGRCTLEKDRCVVGSDADCKNSTWCKDLARCAAAKVDGVMQCRPATPTGG